MNLVAIASNEDGYDKRTAGNTELHRNGHSGNGDGQRAEDDTDDDAHEDRGNIRSIQTADGVTHHVGHIVDGILRTHYHDTVAHLEWERGRGEDVHALTGDAGHVDAMYARKVELAERLAVHRRTGDEHALAHQRLVLLLPVNLNLRTDKGDDGFSVGLGTYHIELVADMEDGVAVGDAHVAFVEDARTYEVAVQEAVHLHQRLAFQIGIRNLHVHLMGFHVGILAFKFFQVFLFFFQTDAADVAHGDRSTDNTDYTQRIGAGIT